MTERQMNDGFTTGSDETWPYVRAAGTSCDRSPGREMLHYFFDIHWDDETVIDEEGTSHFDDGSAIYYGRIVASGIARCGKGERVRVHVRDGHGRLLSILSPGPLRALDAHQARIRDIVERDITRQCTAAG